MPNKKLLENMIAHFVDSKNVDQELRPYMEQKLFEDVRSEIVNLEIMNIRMRVDKEEKERKKENGIIRAKTLILELVFMAFFIGLIVNQTTEWLALMKGHTDPGWFNTVGTILVVAVSAVMIIAFIILSYYGTVDRLFAKKEST